ncbi:PH-like domain-containing protein [Angustibacter luteus]|uniref:PH domain-containing protein n=1 Tax=Angustibacter luteus TaxID=658456 RepID=A0ABW1J9C7_9ACTN
MSRGPAVAIVAVLVLLAWAGMWWGWRSRTRRQRDVPAPPAPSQALADRTANEGVEATYVSTTAANDWLDRIAVHGLGVRSDARVLATDDGIAVVREGAPDLLVPAVDLREVRRESVRAGKAVTGQGLLVWDWDLGGATVSTAVAARHDGDRDALEQQIKALIDQHHQQEAK